jgi:outer membrane receptor protein involved in Fe transport
VPFAVGLTWSGGERTRYELLAELNSAAPEAEQLYIALNRPGANPDWVGNPGLRDPLRGTLRATLDRGPLSLALFGSHVWDYVYLVKRTAAGTPYQTYANVNALLAGCNLQLSWPHLVFRAQWNWGERTAENAPLAEIAPLAASLRLQTPQLHHTRLWLLVEGAAEQTRVDDSLNERPTPGWGRADLGLTLESGAWRLDLRLLNLTDTTYFRHLAYLRNPFASGADVYEPGRSVRLTAVYRY